jgi:hypothetical protein
MPALRILLLCALCAAGASCKRGSDLVAAFAESLDELERAHCECAPVASDCDDRIGIASQCELDVVREHEDEISDWLKCAIREARAATECARECGENGGSCDFDLDDACGEIPGPASQQIEAEIDRRCLEPIDCDDGSVAQGNFCNGEQECRDGSDEAFCGDSDGSSGGVAEPTGPVTVPPSVLPPPTIMPPSVMPPAVMPPPSTTPEQCVEITPATPTINPSCVACVCSVAPDQVVQCDVNCWDLIECMLKLCPDTMSGTSEQTQCALENCMDFLAGAMVATLVGPTIRNTCSAVCPPF